MNMSPWKIPSSAKKTSSEIIYGRDNDSVYTASSGIRVMFWAVSDLRVIATY
ncbi:Uncharacterised protein [Yersinia intermedia]|uniref:Uncharacterized protein n=1 Tax=Yersinia intermedia TaxID=631 RepID=A0A0T9N2V2_YERIN|nr:hypothetical protein CH53_2966 [Yersinia intermedia]CNG73064.1 Uncharacterised protein [Yersinia intermedia]